MNKPHNMVVMTGGGSGGHITPIVSVAIELKKLSPSTKIVYIGQKGDALGDVMRGNPIFDSVYTVRAGKFRRYHGEGLKQLLDVPTIVKNARDLIYVAVGLVQAIWLLHRLKPGAMFCKGGFVSVPVGLAAAALHVPFITHDSDALPGLANRIISRWAFLHAVGLPKEVYHYPAAKTVTVGVPINQQQYKPVTKELMLAARAALDVPANAKIIFVTGGGLGALRVNRAMTKNAKLLFSKVPRLYIFHQAGRKDESATRAAYTDKLTAEQLTKVRIFGFTDDMARLSEASDIVITRAGATNVAEFAQQGKVCIIIPNPQLTGGHQLKNANVYYKAEAAVILLEEDLDNLAKITVELLEDTKRQRQLSENLRKFAMPKAAESLAQLLLTILEGH